MLTGSVALAISRQMIAYPDLFSAYDESSSSPSVLIQDFRKEGVTSRGYLTAHDLYRVALLKNGGKLSQKTKNALASNNEDIVREFTRIAISSDHPELAVRILLALDGVRLPTASCVLAWVLPHKWPVIDRRAWNSVASFSSGVLPDDPVGGLKVGHWLQYVAIVREIAGVTGRKPQEVDTWLYTYDKKRPIK